MKSKAEFATKLGLIAATVGSAVGLGNVWRFPAETQSHGGAAFLLLYIVCVLVLGIPVMLAEFSLGRGSRADAIGSFLKFAPKKKWWIVGLLAVLASYLILCYYMVVAGWTLEYLVESVTGGLYQGMGQAGNLDDTRALFMSKMDEYICSDIKPLVYTLILIGINTGVLLGGVRNGIERLSNWLMPVLFVILAIMVAVCLSLPDAMAGVRFFLEPDFSRITPGVVVSALGQAFFSLSLGMGILITYSSYYPDKTNLTQTSVVVALLSLLVAVMMGLIIFPAVKSFGLDHETLRGTTLVFVTLPEIFGRMPLSELWSVLFFVLLLVAALTSTVSISEVSVAMLEDRFGMSRRRAVLTVMLPLVLLSSLCSLSFGSLSDFTILDMSIFDFLDTTSTNILLPTVSLGVCLFVGWAAPKQMLADELTNYGRLRSGISFTAKWIIRYAAPALIVLITIYKYL